MIFTLLCQLLLLDTWTRTSAYPSSEKNANTNPAVTLNLIRPSSSATPLISYLPNPQKSNHPFDHSSQILSRRRERQSPQSDSWLFPPANPTRRSYYSSTYNSNSNGLAYRSILPIRSSANSHYSGPLYRNRNLFSDGGVDENSDDYNYNYNNYHDANNQGKKNDFIPSSKSGDGYNANPGLKLTTTTTAIVTTAESSGSKSAPATEAGSISSTSEMKDDYPDLGSRDAFGVSNTKPNNNAKKERTPKIHKEETGDSAIIFPGNTARPPAKRHQQSPARPGKTNFNSEGDDSNANYQPPFKALDKPALESLKVLLENSRRKSQVSTKISQYNYNSSKGRPSSSPTSPLDIRGRPKCAAQNAGYCEEIDSYPRDFFNQILKNSLTITPDVFQEVFGDSIDNKTLATDVAGRDGLNIMLEQPLCNSIEHTIYPKVAENKEGQYMYIVNHDEYIQGVRVEKCVKENSPCMYLEGSLTGYQSSCRQKYIYRKLLAFTRDGKATTDTFRLPACCVCHVRSVFVDDRINTAGFLPSGGSSSDQYSPSSIVVPKNGANANDDWNATIVDGIGIIGRNSSLTNSTAAVTEVGHDDQNDQIVEFPTSAPSVTFLDLPSNYSGVGSEEVTTDPVIGLRMF